MTIIVRKASIPITGTCITAALIFGGMATPANAADDQSNNAPIAAGQVADAAGAKVVVD